MYQSLVTGINGFTIAIVSIALGMLMTKPSIHPEGSLELSRLKDILVFISRKLDELKSLQPTYDYANVVKAIQNRQFELRDSLQKSEEDAPYFGRFDFREEGSETVDELYIAKSAHSTSALSGWKHNVVSWASPIGGTYYATSQRTVHFRSPGGDVKGEVLLRRALAIRRRKLEQINDLFDVRGDDFVAGETVSTATKVTDEEEPAKRQITDPEFYFRQILEGKTGRGLKEVVTSIQERQNELMRTDADQILIIQGAAGSGKTTIALHRIAILLHSMEHQKQGESRRMLVVGPNRLFLNFISQVLPSLNLSGVRQRTFADWASTVTAISELSEVQDLTLPQVYNPRKSALEEAREAYGQSLEKGRTQHLSELEELIEDKRVKAQSIFYKPALETAIQGVQCFVEQQVIESLVERTKDLPINRQREEVAIETAQLLYDQYEDKTSIVAEWIAGVLSDPLGASSAIARQWKEQLENLGYEWNDTLNGMIRPEREIQERRRNRTLRSVKSEILQFVKGEMKSLSALQLYLDFIGASDADYTLRVEDVAPVTYLHFKLEGNKTNLDHVIVDEAQDMSPVEMWLLRNSLTSGSMTILGDLAQSIHSYRGISSWNDFDDVFPDDKVKLETIYDSYRSTYEIMTFANKMLRTKVLKRFNFPDVVPFLRHGEPVRQFGVDSEEELRVRILKEIRRLLKSELETIALICNDVKECESMHQFLLGHEIRPDLVNPQDVEINGKLIVIPAFLAKGIEFDVCIIVDASQSKYPSDVRYGRLLYVAITRALHELIVFWKGNPSTHLPD
ncbi:MAG: AAA family ATPase [Anaerolineaceae bacterium]|nr:AAA family ATPase [Anaerolineaceae bacterium]